MFVTPFIYSLKQKEMTKFDDLPKYKAQRSYLDYIIYLEFADGKGTWSVWDTVKYDGSEIDARLLYGNEEKGFLVRNDLLESGTYKKRMRAIEKAKLFIEAYEASFQEEEELVAAA